MRGLDRHSDGGELRDGDDRLGGNFSATPVRFYFSLARAPPGHASRCLHLRVMAPPVVPLELTTVRETLFAMTAVDAVNVPMIAVAAQVEELPASVDDALDLSEIVHSGARPPGTRPPRETRATTLSSNASTRGDLGSEGDVSEPYSLVAVARDPPTALGAGPTTGPLISALSPTVDKRPSPVTPGIGRLDLKPLDDGAPIFSDRNPQRVRARAFRACSAFRGHSAPTGVAPAAPSRTRGGALPHPVTGPRPPSLAISSPRTPCCGALYLVPRHGGMERLEPARPAPGAGRMVRSW